MRTPAARLAALLVAGCGITGAGSVLAQAPARAFEVASVKPRDPDNPRSMMVGDASGRFTTMNIPVVMLIRTAYGLQNDQVIGGPDWMRSEGFNITAKAPEGTPVTAMGPLLESLLAERFQLTFHREKRELPVYALVTARSIELQWTPDQLPPRAPGTPADQPIRVNGVDIDPNGPSLFTALQEQLGLKLDFTRGPVEVMVIDRLERPSPD